MADPDKDLAELRKEHKELSDHSGRLAIVFLTILTLLGISFSRAWNRVNSVEAENLVCQIFRLHEESLEHRRYDCSINVSYVFEPKVEKYEGGLFRNLRGLRCNQCPTVIGPETPTPSPPCDCQSRVTQIEAREKRASEEFERILSGPPAPEQSPTPGPTLTALPASEDTACQCQRKLEAELEAKASAWFAAKLPIPGVDLHVDLRIWVVVLPMLFSLCGLYLYILRKKEDLLWAIGNQRLRERGAAEISVVDRLHFESASGFRRFPSKLTTFLFVAFYLFMPAYIGYRAWDSWQTLGGSALIFLPLIILCAVYAVGYGLHVKEKLESQIAEITKEPRRKLELWRRLGQTVPPWLTVMLGSGLILATLTLSVTRPYWWSGQGVKGWAFLREPATLNWVMAPRDRYSYVGWFFYLAALGLAIVAILFVLWFKRKGTKRLMFVAAANILAYFIIDLTIGIVGFFDFPQFATNRAKLILYIATVAWTWWAAAKMAHNETKSEKVLRTLTVVFAPAILISLGFAWWLKLPGLVALVGGLLFLVLGSVHAHYRLSLLKDN